MTRFFTTASLLAVSFVAAQATAGTILLDATTNNGSFETPVAVDDNGTAISAGNTTGTTAFGIGAGGGTRAARTSNGSMTAPGWTFEYSQSTGFAGINFNSSTPSQDGLQSFVMNNGGLAVVRTEEIAATINTGDIIKWRGYIGLNALSGSEQMAYNMGLYFDGSTTENRVVDTVFTDQLGYNLHEGEFVYTGPGASSIQLGFVVNVAGSLGGQAVADSFYLEVVPEPSSLALLGFGGLAMLRRRRG